LFVEWESRVYFVMSVAVFVSVFVFRIYEMSQ